MSDKNTITGDAFDEPAPSGNDEAAIRIKQLALDFLNSKRGFTADELKRRFYPEIAESSFNKTFTRDREDLASCGLVVRLNPDMRWCADLDASLCDVNGIKHEDALAIYVAVRPLLDDATFVHHEDLAMALTRLLPPSEGGAPDLHLNVSFSTSDTGKLPNLREAWSRRRAVNVTYMTAAGATKTATLCVYGFFDLRGRTYVVGLRSRDGEDAAIRTLRVSRISRVTDASPAQTYEVPADFNIDDWRHLPFQLGAPRHEATFLVPTRALHDLELMSLGEGTIERGEDSTWTVEVFDDQAAAVWAVAAGITPLSPTSLVDHWHRVLEGALEVDRSIELPQPVRVSHAGRPSALKQARRVVSEMGWLVSAEDGIDASDVAERFSIPIEKARRDIEIIQELGPDLEGCLPVYGEDGQVRMLNGRGVHGYRCRLTRDETVALLAALRAVGASETDPVTQSIVQAIGASDFDASAIDQLLATPVAARYSDKARACYQAVANRSLIRFAYQGARDEAPRDRTACPLSFDTLDGNDYLIAYDVDRAATRNFRVDRMGDIVDAGTFDLEQAQDAGESTPQTVTLTFADVRPLLWLDWPNLDGDTAPVAPYTATTVWYGSDWLPRHVAACGGLVTCDDAELTRRVEAVRTEALGA